MEPKNKNNDMLNVAHAISSKIKLLEHGRNSLNQLAVDKANALGNYSKVFEQEVMKLKSEGMQATLIGSVAKGKCYEQEIAKDLAESMYKIAVIKLDAIKSELNGLLSINRNLSDL